MGVSSPPRGRGPLLKNVPGRVSALRFWAQFLPRKGCLHLANTQAVPCSPLVLPAHDLPLCKNWQVFPFLTFIEICPGGVLPLSQGRGLAPFW
ncbi:hypothetical protein L0F63_006221 [Massospora cicadina]|nr:hypothetical protein L0F63_006221 [Massospora cicadina]